MSRSGYGEDYDGDNYPWEFYRSAVDNALHGRRGQSFLREMITALDAMPEQKLIAHDLIRNDGMVCAIGAVGKVRGIDMDGLDPEDADNVARIFGIAPSMAREIVYMNDEYNWKTESPEERWRRMRDWVASHLRDDAPVAKAEGQS